jgi:hypothetical protein
MGHGPSMASWSHEAAAPIPAGHLCGAECDPTFVVPAPRIREDL